ncbi:MAG: beta-1,6-galactofuranosyltransferase, partial [Streptococcaceae bacterium]|nr:beta-1,6-galactofuranosyltransferase [Streptococcaceae bacterium]
MTNWITRFATTDEAREQSWAVSIMGKNISEQAQRMGFKEICISDSLSPFLSNQPDKRAAIIAALLDPVKPGDTVFVQYPLWIQLNFQTEFFAYIKENRKAKSVAIIHDVLDYMMAGDDFVTDNSFDLYQLSHYFDLIIAHNEKFAQRLKNDGINLPMVSLHLFDYPHEVALKKKTFKHQLYYPTGRELNSVDYSGKTTIKVISRMEKGNPDWPDNVEYLGGMTSKEVMAFFDGGFGLVNSNNMVEQETPGVREYAKYNNPTKLSTYIASGLPVIVTSESAHAEWIK